MISRHEHEAAALAVKQCWRESGCRLPEVASTISETCDLYSGEDSMPTLLPRAWPRLDCAIPYQVKVAEK